MNYTEFISQICRFYRVYTDEYCSNFASGGRIQIPVDVRRSLPLSDGDTVLIEVADGEVRLRPQRDAIKRVQERMRKYVVEGHTVVDQLIAERREAARNE